MSSTGSFKVGVVGCGKVGMTAAYAMMLSGTPTEMVLVDRNKDKAMGEKLDLEHATSLLSSYVAITGTDDYGELTGSRLVVFTAGAAQASGQTRLDLAATNKKILSDLLPKIHAAAPEAVVLIVANPVDVLTYFANKIIADASGKIFGSGTMLDTARFRFHLGEKLNINPHSVHAYVLGEHGETSFPVYAQTQVGGQKLVELPGVTEETIATAYQKTRDAAAKIIEAKGATYYAIGVVVTKIMQAIFSDSKTVFPLSMPLENYVGISGVALSVPCILGANGVEKILEVDFSPAEREKLNTSAAALLPFCHE